MEVQDQAEIPTTEVGRFRQQLLEAGLLRQTAVDGVYHRSGIFEGVVRAVEALVSTAGGDQAAHRFYFPPVMPRSSFELTDYLRSFPDLIGAVQSFVGSDQDHAALLALAESRGDWSQALTSTEVMLTSAACHPLYETLTGTLPAGGVRFEVQGYCFRHEPSLDPARMQSFRQHEFVYVGDEDGAVNHRDMWLERGLKVLSALGLPVYSVVANDPFFGRAGRILAANQRETALKYEIVCPITSVLKPTAITSANCHLDHFGAPFGISTSDGRPAHSACIGFGLERITLALLQRHGLDPAGWSRGVRDQLWPN